MVAVRVCWNVLKQLAVIAAGVAILLAAASRGM